MSRITRSLNNPFLMFVLVGLYPPVFLASKNWFIYTGTQLCILVLLTSAVVLFLGAIFYSVCWGLLKIAARLLKQKVSLPQQLLLHGLATLFACITIVFLLQSSIFSEGEKPVLTIAIIVLGTIAIILFVAKAGLWRFNLIAMCIVSMAAFEWRSSNAQFSESDLAWYDNSREEFRNVSFRKKPNVYAIVMESHHNSEAMREIYGLDIRPFVEGLEERGVRAYPDCYANYNYTTQTLACVFTMQHHYYKTSVGADDAFGVRDIIGGKVYNPVLDVFRDNGYARQYIFFKDCAFNAGSLLSYAYPESEDGCAEVLGIYQNGRLTDVSARLLGDKTGISAHLQEGKKNEYYLRMLGRYGRASHERIMMAANSSEPYFTVLKPGALDHAHITKDWHELVQWGEHYRKLVAEYNSRYIRLIDFIVKNDPNAIIIMFGDHGPSRYRNVWVTKGDVNEALERRGVAGKTVALDQFGTFLGIRYPGGDPDLIAAKSHVNLFRNLFATLSEDQSLLETSVEDISMLYFWTEDNRVLCVGARDAKPLDLWETIETQ
ncbi:hypothetical protein ACFL1X_10940 [Candidatus Hydrogenedentota bacterium]